MRNQRLVIQVTQSEKDVLTQAAELAGMKLSEYVRFMLVEPSRNLILEKQGKISTDTLVVLNSNRTSTL